MEERGTEVIPFPPRSPNLNAYAERFGPDAPDFAKFWMAEAKCLAEVVKVVGKVEDKK